MIAIVVTSLADEVLFHDEFPKAAELWPHLECNTDNVAVYRRDKQDIWNYVSRFEQVAAPAGTVLAFSAEVEMTEPLQNGVLQLQCIAFYADAAPQHIISRRNWSKTNGREMIEMLFRVPENCKTLEPRLAISGIGEVKIYSCTLSKVPERVKELDVLRTYDFTSDIEKWQLEQGIDPDGKPVAICRTTGAGPFNYRSSLEQIPLTGEQYITYRAEVRIDQPLERGDFTLELIVFRNGGDPWTIRAPYSLTQTSGWQELLLVYQTPPDTQSIELRLGNHGSGTVYVRSCSLSIAGEDSFERSLLPHYAGTLEEQQILNSWACLSDSSTAAPNLSLDYRNPPEGWRYALDCVWYNPFQPNGQASISSFIEDAERNIRIRKVSKVSFLIRELEIDPKIQLSVCFNTRSGWGPSSNAWIAELSGRSKPGQWRQIVLSRNDFKSRSGDTIQAKWEDISWNTPTILIEGQGKAHFQIAGFQVHCTDGFRGTAWSKWSDPFWYFLKNHEPAISPPADRKYLNFHGGGGDWLDSEEGRDYFLQIQKLVPNLAIQSNLCLDSLLRHRDWLKKHDIVVGYQNATPFLWQAAVAADALSTPRDAYAELNERHHKIDYTSEAWRDIYREVAKRFSRYGIGEYQIIDGHYTTSDAKAGPRFKRILKEEDPGIIMFDGSVIHFWDYFEAYTGFRWTPKDFGWETWDEYTHASRRSYTAGNAPEACRRGYLDMALRHYEYMRWHADVGDIFRSHGVRYFLMNNGDDWTSGNDWIFNSSTRGVAGFVEETFFYHPATFIKAYFLSLAMNTVFQATGTHHRLIAESGAGGHGPIYWAPEFSYSAIFDICAARKYDSLEIDWPGETTFANLSNPDRRYDYNRLCDYLAKAWAYNDATLFTDYQPLPESAQHLVLQATSTMFAGPSLHLMNPENSAYPVSVITPQLFKGDVATEARLVFNDQYALPVGFAKTLLSWLDASPENVLVLCGASAGREIDGTMWSNVFGWPNDTMNRPDQFSDIFGKLSKKGTRFFPEKAGEIILKDAEGPILSLYRRPGGARIYYCHLLPDDANRPTIKGAIDEIMRRESVSPIWKDDVGSAIIRHYIGADGTRVFTVFDRKPLDNYSYVQGGRNPEYTWHTPGSVISGKVTVPPGEYLLYGVLTGKKEKVTVDKTGFLTLPLKDISCEVYYLLPRDGGEVLKRLQKRHSDLSQWLGKRQINLP